MKKKNKTLCRCMTRPWTFIIVIAFVSTILLPMQTIGQTKRFTLLHTSDEHSVLMPLPAVDYHPEKGNPSKGGFARLSAMVKTIRQEKAGEPVLLFSSGDFIGGSPYAWLILEGYSPEIELMKAIGYDAVTIGNHEFDYGPDKLAEYFVGSGYPQAHGNLPLIASNLNIPPGHALYDVEFLPNKMFELDNGLKVGVFGLLGNVAYSVAPLAEPVGITDPFVAAQKQVDYLRSAGADVVVALSHSGVDEDYELAKRINNIDIILGGHDHYQTSEPVLSNNTILLHSSYYVQYLGMLEVEFDETTRAVRLVNDVLGSPYQIAMVHTVPEDSLVAGLVDEYTLKLNNFITDFSDSLFTDALGHVMHTDFAVTMHAPLVETTVGNFVTDAMRLETEKVTGRKVDFAIQANGVIRGDIIPGTMSWSQGKVSFMDLVNIAGLGSGPELTAGYPMVSIYLTAQEVYSVFEIAGLLSQLMGDTYFLQVSGVRYNYDPGKAIWLRIPFLGLPVPAYRSLKEVYLYEGQGIQNDDGYVLLDKNSDRLYHLVSDHYLTSFLPMIGEILPKLKIVLKNEQGEPVDIDETIVYHQGREFKVWEAVARHALAFEKGASQMPEMPQAYQTTQGRINVQKGVPLYIWSYAGLIAVLAALGWVVVWLVKKIKRRKRA
jgi:5'-nucleotidase / UDP-sugar diphosphatase